MRLTNSRNIQTLRASGFFKLRKSLIISVRVPNINFNSNIIYVIYMSINLINISYLFIAGAGLTVSYNIILVQSD